VTTIESSKSWLSEQCSNCWRSICIPLVVTNQQQASLEDAQRLCQTLDGLDIEMVRRLIE